MTKFENMINGGKMESRTINVIITDLKKDDTFDAWINAKTLQEIDHKLPKGYEMDRMTTLENYFDPTVVEEFRIELNNSQYIYFEDFDKLYNGGFKRYIDGQRKDLSICSRMDRRFQF